MAHKKRTALYGLRGVHTASDVTCKCEEQSFLYLGLAWGMINIHRRMSPLSMSLVLGRRSALCFSLHLQHHQESASATSVQARDLLVAHIRVQEPSSAPQAAERETSRADALEGNQRSACVTTRHHTCIVMQAHERVWCSPNLFQNHTDAEVSSRPTSAVSWPCTNSRLRMS